MFDPIQVEANTAFFRRTSAITFDPESDGWGLQRFNTRRIKALSSLKWRGASRARRLLGRLLDRLHLSFPSPSMACLFVVASIIRSR
jgi:hypothetical protein